MSYGVYRRRYIAPPPPQSLAAVFLATARIRNNANTTVTHLAANDYRIEKTSGGSADNADAVGTVALTGDFIIAVHVIDDDINIHLGVSADATTSSSYAAIQRAIQFYRPDNKVYYYESGVLDTVGSFSYISGVAPYVWMRRIGTSVTVLSNTVDDINTATLRKTMTDLSGAVYFDSAFFDVGDKIDVNLVATAPVIGRANETDAALGLGIFIGLGRADETDTAFTLSVPAIGRADETDTALGLGAAIGLGLASEADTALGLAGATGLGRANETDAALGLGATIGLGRASETDTALALNPVLVFALGMASETDAAFALTAWINAAGSVDSWSGVGASSPTWAAVSASAPSWAGVSASSPTWAAVEPTTVSWTS